MFKKCGAGKVALLATTGQRAPNLLRGAPQGILRGGVVPMHRHDAACDPVGPSSLMPQGKVNRPAHLQGKN
ncbi:MAG: hypothetical protein R2825_23470 [Saprospiraceae bacterium]